MSEDIDDYLSDAFLTEATHSKDPISYTERRRRVQRESELKNLENRKRSRKDLEETALQEGLNKSLFERAQDERSTITSGGNKAMKMMLNMGFKVGQSLGMVDSASNSGSGSIHEPTTHRTEPIPIRVWSGEQ
jgi:hypothetical protein